MSYYQLTVDWWCAPNTQAREPGPFGGNVEVRSQLLHPYRSVGRRGQVMEQLKESGRLAQEQVAIGEESHRAHGRAHGIGGPDDRAHRKRSAQEGAGLRHDQVGLEQLPAKRGLIQVRKDQSSVLGVGERRSVAGLIEPCLEVRSFGRPNAEQDS